MSEYPDNWFRGGGAGNSPGVPGGASASAGGDSTIQVPGSAYPPTAAGLPGASPGGGSTPGSAWPEQPPVYGGQRGALGGRAAGSGSGGSGGWSGWRQRWLRPRRISAVIGVVIALIIVATVGMYFYVNSKLVRQDVLVSYTGRPALGAGQNWLITGSDSRQGLTRKQELQYATGKLNAISGQRSDTILILHMPSNGQPPVLLSIPRDSYVPIPGYGSNKINAAFAFGGPRLLAETLQNVTGLYINHYMGIGFGGLVSVVNDVGGGYVRTRNFAISDLQREQDQRLFLKALLSKMTSAGTFLNPFAAIPAATGSAGALTVDQGTSLYDLVKAAFALRNPETTTVPVATANYQTSAGVSVQWDRNQALRLFNALKNDTPVPRGLLTGSKATATG